MQHSENGRNVDQSESHHNPGPPFKHLLVGEREGAQRAFEMPPNPLRFLENQLFDYWDIPVVVILFFFELLLSADNAVIIAQFVRHVDPKKQNLALYTGVASSFFLRLIAR